MLNIKNIKFGKILSKITAKKGVLAIVCLLMISAVVIKCAIREEETFGRESETGRKTRSTLYPASLAYITRENAANYKWAQDIADKVISGAEYFKNMSDDELWSLIIGPDVGYRSLMVWSDGHCPSCKQATPMYSWIYEPKTNPWKIRCPHCEDEFPKNDFKAFHDSGIDDRTGNFSYDSADKSLLFNKEYSESDDPLFSYGVDDGFGYSDGVNTWYFIGYYLYRAYWQSHIIPGIQDLSMAYFVTGEQVYAHKAAILIDRIADYFPLYDFLEQGLNYEKHQTPGYFTYCIDSATNVRFLAEAYDQIYDGIKDDDSLVRFLSGKAVQYSDFIKNPKSDFYDIQNNIENRIFRDALANDKKIHANFPGVDITKATVLYILNDNKSLETMDEIIADFVEQTTMYDGVTLEKGLNNYTTLAVMRLGAFLNTFSRTSDTYLKDLFEKIPSLNDTFMFFIDTWCNEKYYPAIGDGLTDFAARNPYYIGLYMDDEPSGLGYYMNNMGSYTLLWNIYKITGDNAYAKLIYNDLISRGYDIENHFPNDILAQNVSEMQTELKNIIKTEGSEIIRGSVNKHKWGIALMRSSKNNTSPVFWIHSMNQEMGYNHSHADFFNLGLFGYGLNLMVDFGYPPENKRDYDEYYWYSSPEAHNMVVPLFYEDEFLYNTTYGETLGWLDDENFRGISLSKPDIDDGKRYDRSVYMSNISDDNVYLVDIFRLDGWLGYTNFYSTQYATLNTKNMGEMSGDLSEIAPTFNFANYKDIWKKAVLKDVKIGYNAEFDWSAEFELADYWGYRNNDDAPVYVNFTDLTYNSIPLTALAWVQDNYSTANEAYIPRIGSILISDDAETIKAATFVTVIEPYESQSMINEITRLNVYDQDREILPENYICLEIKLTDGSTEYIFSCDIQDERYKKDEFKIYIKELNIFLKADFGMIKIKNNEIIQNDFFNLSYISY